MSNVPVPNPAAPIGAFVRQHMPQLLDYCRANPKELANLQDQRYCLATLRQSYPVLVAVESEFESDRYWQHTLSQPFIGLGFRVTSQWKSGLHTAHLVAYLVDKGITPVGVDEDFVAWARETVDNFGTTGNAPGGPRYRATALGAAQNALVRHLLGSLGFDAFTEADWVHVKGSEFAGRCAYCGITTKTTMDHAIPINRLHLGEHRLGNLVPACARCNAQKGNKTPADYLRLRYADDPVTLQERMDELEAHERRHGYRPIEDYDGVRPIIEEARARVKELADEFRDRINHQLAQSQGLVVDES